VGEEVSKLVVQVIDCFAVLMVKIIAHLFSKYSTVSREIIDVPGLFTALSTSGSLLGSTLGIGRDLHR
jgi:hypothetical protein